MKKFIFVILCLTLISLTGCGEVYPTNTELVVDQYNYKDVIIGVWHASPAVGAGYSDKYHFYEDGTFRFDYNQYDAEKRDIALYGTWKLERNLLYLTIKSKKTRVGGEFVKSPGPIISEYTLKNSEIVVKDLEREQEVIYPLGEVIENVNDSPYLYMTIGNLEYWRISSDPTVYED